jgi:hypothetical protein
MTAHSHRKNIVTSIVVSIALVPAAVACAPHGETLAAPPAGSSAAASPDGSSAPTTGQRITAESSVPAPSDKVIVGSYRHFIGKSAAQAQALRDKELGRSDRIVSTYYAWTDRMPHSFPGLPVAAIPMISWRATSYQSILDGSQDSLIRSNAKALAAYGKPVLMRFAWEMNGHWFPWGGTRNPAGAKGFVQAWRHVHDIFTKAGATNVSWVWCVNWNNNPDTRANDARLYYPGNAYVDWIGVDGFSDAGESPEQLFGPFYRAFAATGKPLMIAETGVAKTDQGRAPDAVGAWITGLATWIKQHPAIRSLVWFDTDQSAQINGTTNWRIDAHPGELPAYRKVVNDPYFGG